MTSPTPETPQQTATRIITDTLQWPANEREGATVLGDDDVTHCIEALTRAGIITTHPTGPLHPEYAVEYRLSPDTPWRPIAGLPVEGDDLMADHWIANERVARRRAEYAAKYGNQTRLVCRYITEEVEA